MIQISNLSVHFGQRYLFDNISFVINPKDKIGLIGRNGSGKTTLLKIIAGEETFYEGSIIKPNDYTIGFLPQEFNIHSEKSVFEESSEAIPEITQLEKKICYLTTQIANKTNYTDAEYQKLLNELSAMNTRFSLLGGNKLQSEVEKVLLGLGFKREEFETPINSLSGGWQMRVELAKILLRKPHCILLDEPTNHLDIDSIQWLEKFLKDYPFSVVIVSHDKVFLDNITSRTIEISNSRIYDMNLPYSKFIVQREKQKQQLLSTYKTQQKEIEQIEKFIERFRYKATLASRVQSRIKQLEKLERIEIEEDSVATIKLRFPKAPPSGKLVVEAKNLSKSYGDKLVLNNLNFAIERNDKICFLGRNGEGKSTLAKIIAGYENYFGNLNIGYNVKLGYYAQHQPNLLDPNLTVLETIENVATGEIRTQIRKLLGAFLFSGDDVNKKVKVLSGGEKSRLALCKLLLQPYNFLVLDEPTNHLDINSKEVLKKALQDFEGAIILISHDRDFLRELTNKTIFFKDHSIIEYPGSIEDFLSKYNKLILEEDNSQDQATLVPPKYSEQKTFREQKKQLQREKNKLKKEIQALEEEITNLEAKVAEIEQFFSAPESYQNAENIKHQQLLYKKTKEKLDQRLNLWSQLVEKYDEFQNSD